MGSLTNLQVLDIATNFLNGTLPLGLQNLQNLIFFDLSQNFLGGPLPDFSNFLKLVEVKLNTNYATNGPEFGFSGTIPSSLGLLTSLVTLDLYENRLTGVLPGELGSLIKLQVLDVASNTLTGFVPQEYSGLSSLKALYLNGTHIQGSIPTKMCSLQAYIEVDCSVSCSCCSQCS